MVLIPKNVSPYNHNAEHLISSSDQKSIFDHDRLISLQKSIFRSDHRFSIFDRFFDFFLAGFHHT